MILSSGIPVTQKEVHMINFILGILHTNHPLDILCDQCCL